MIYLIDRLRERATFARAEKTATALADAKHFEDAAQEIERLRAPDQKELAFIICNEIRSDIDPRDADRAAASIVAYLCALPSQDQKPKGSGE